MNDFEFGDTRYLSMFKRTKECTLSPRAVSCYSFIVGQDFHGSAVKSITQLSRNTGLSRQGLHISLDELLAVHLIREEDGKFLACKPGESANFFKYLSRPDEWQHNFQFYKLLLRKINGGLSFNESLILSILIGMRSPAESLQRLIVPSINFEGLATMSAITAITVSTVIDSLGEKGLIGVSNVRGKNFSVWIPEIGDNAKYFVAIGDDNCEAGNIESLGGVIEEMIQRKTGVAPVAPVVEEEYTAAELAEMEEMRAEIAILEAAQGGS